MAKLQTPMSMVKLNNGAKMPQLGFGTGTAHYKKSENEIDTELVKIIGTAIKSGYRHLDGAEVYNTERELGKAIKESKVPRDELFVTTKVVRDMDHIKESLDASLKKLGLDYVDMYYIHVPFVGPDNDDAARGKKLQECWAVMEELLESGKTRGIAVSNFLQKHLEAILATAKVVPAVNQIEYNPYLQHGDLLKFHESKGIATACYGPSTPATKAKPGPLDDLLAQLAKKYYVNETEICLRYCFDKGAVPITTSSKEQRMSDYMRVVAFKLTPREMEDMDRLGAEKHYRGFWTDKFDADDRS